jgi:soluble lytic murein transglycosylase-like protein
MNEHLLQAVHDRAVAAGLDADLVIAIIHTESGGDTYAIRYEPHYRWLCDVERWSKRQGITAATEETLQKMSFGLGQVMGAVARQHGFGKPLQRLCEPDHGLEIMIKHLRWLRLKCASDTDLMAAYNGGWGALRRSFSGAYPNQPYIDKVSKTLGAIRAGQGVCWNAAAPPK